MVFQLGGMPVGGALPLFFGANTKYYFADSTNGLSGNDGSTPETAKSTIAAAVTLMNERIDWAADRWANNDVLVLAPEHTPKT